MERTVVGCIVDWCENDTLVHKLCNLVHLQILGIDLLHVLEHLLGITEERGMDEVVFP